MILSKEEIELLQRAVDDAVNGYYGLISEAEYAKARRLDALLVKLGGKSTIPEWHQ